MESHKGNIHHNSGNQRLKDPHHNSLAAHLAQLSQTELVADGEGDKAQGYIGDDV